jgi:hypothetical protein
MRIYKWLSLFFLVCLMTGCGRENISLNNFNESQWKDDRMACTDKREKLSVTLISQKNQLLSHDEMDIVKVLGKPDEQELYKRNEKFYYYYVEPSATCQSGSKNAKRLIIRFNAVGLAKEILIE